MNKLLEIKNISLTYQTLKSETEAIKNISFDVSKGEFVSIVGPSGSGKTTILSLIAGLIAPSSGEIFIDGKQVKNVSTDVGYMFQRDNLFEWINIYQNVLIGPKINHNKNCLSKIELKSLINKYGLGGFEKAKPTELSGGMRQRVSLIRTLALNPKILLLDEPFSALDSQTRLSVQNNIHSIIKSEHKTAILVTHDISEAISMSNRIIVLTKRPGTIKTIFNLEFNESLTPLERRNDPIFNSYFKSLWDELQ
ncbi:MAG: ABC transporter ATP-binding protein [Clostridiales bacterium]|nr:ABC transporter ATP-binding protein [Clostridiales bacterium]